MKRNIPIAISLLSLKRDQKQAIRSSNQALTLYKNRLRRHLEFSLSFGRLIISFINKRKHKGERKILKANLFQNWYYIKLSSFFCKCFKVLFHLICLFKIPKTLKWLACFFITANILKKVTIEIIKLAHIRLRRCKWQ